MSFTSPFKLELAVHYAVKHIKDFYIFIDTEAPKSVGLHRWNKMPPSLHRNAQPTCMIALWPKLVTTTICNQSQTVKKSNAITRQPLVFHSHVELAILFLL